MTLAIIPARQGSKGIKNKNIIKLCKKPLILYTIEAALECPFFDKILVTTDSPEISELASKYCSVTLRPDNLAMDDTPLAPVIIHTLHIAEKRYDHIYDTIVTLQPTSPLRDARHIAEAWYSFQDSKADSLLSACETRHSIWQMTNGSIVPIRQVKHNRQLLQPYYIANGAIFITKKKILLEERDRIGGKIAIYLMNREDSVDIHNIWDLDLAKWYLKRR